jgi:hypothetical protein
MNGRDEGKMNRSYPPLRNLKVGDRVRLMHLPHEYVPRHTLHRDTRRLYARLLARRRSVCVHKIDEDGLPWIHCRFKRKNGNWEYHYMLIGTESGWTKVKPRKRSSM